MIGFPLGVFASNASEWFIHKYLLHGRGKNRKSFWAFHFHDHHKEARKADFKDEAYLKSLWGWHPQSKEALSLTLVTVAAFPFFPIAPFFVSGMVYNAGYYYYVHKKSHLDPEWAREHLKWHYDHHMGPNQDMNWCVTRPWFDHIMGTRVPYAGTEREARDRANREAIRARVRAKARGGAEPDAESDADSTVGVAVPA